MASASPESRSPRSLFHPPSDGLLRFGRPAWGPHFRGPLRSGTVDVLSACAGVAAAATVRGCGVEAQASQPQTNVQASQPQTNVRGTSTGQMANAAASVPGLRQKHQLLQTTAVSKEVSYGIMVIQLH
ncbi:hypothetical protein ABZP36_007944 [Zizania latifolia]